MNRIERLYKQLVNSELPQGERSIDGNVRTELFQKILSEVDRLRKKLVPLSSESPTYKEIDSRLRLLLLKEIQVIIDEYVVARNHGALDEWSEMYGSIDLYVTQYFYYRMDQQYDAKSKVLTDYRFSPEETRSI
jgi:hypothetical protein